MLAATLVRSLLIGVSLGLLGGGVSIITVPILVYVAGQDPKAAIAMSLLVVGVTSAVGAVSHARAGRVQWRTGLIFGGAGMVGAYGGGRVAEFIPGTWLMVALGLMMAVAAAAMLRGRRALTSEQHGGQVAVGRSILDGVVVGAVTGVIGAGGGFLVVPALVLLGGVPMTTAVGTSLVVIALKSGAGLLGYLVSTSVDWPLAVAVTTAAVVGSLVGGRIGGRISEEHLRRGFGWFVAVMAIVVLSQQLPADVRGALLTSPMAWTELAAAAVAGAAVGLRRWQHQRSIEPNA